MSKVIIAMFAFTALLLGSVQGAEKPVKIYIFAGQSNMEARYGKDFLEKNHPELLKDKQIWHVQVGWTNGPIQACPNFGVDRAMVYKIAEGTGQDILVLRCAVGGTVLQTNWRPPSAVKRAGGTLGPLYINLVNRFHNLVANLKEVYPAYHGQGYEIAGFVWFQGECDACTDTEVNGVKVNNCHFYEDNLKDLISDVRRDFGAPEMPVLIAQINVSDPWEGKVKVKDSAGNTVDTTAGQVIRDIEKKVAESTPKCVWVETLGLDKGYHYDAASYITIGQRMGDAMLSLAKQVKVADPKQMERARNSYYNRQFPDLKPNTKSLAKGLISYFTFDEGKGMSVADASSRNYTGELKSAGQYTPEWVKGVSGSALKFMANNYVGVADFADPVTKDGKIDRLSMSYWINKTGHCGYGGHLAKREGKLGWWIDERHNGNLVDVHLMTEKGEYAEGADNGEPLTLGDGYEWHHIAVVFDGPSQRFDTYFDGKMLSRKKVHVKGVDGAKDTVVTKRPEAWQILSAGEKAPLRIGQQGWFGSMQGPSEAQSIDEVAIWDRALTEAEVQALYNNGRGIKIPVK